MSNPSSLKLFQPSEATAIDDRIAASLRGSYPWDEWKQEALAADVSLELAELGRAVMREVYQHGWCDALKYECGGEGPDTAAAMIAAAKWQPDLTASRWQWLLVTDGLRFDPWKRQQWPENAPEWLEMRRRWDTETNAEKPLPMDAILRREACFYIEEFYKLNQLAVIDLSGDTVRHDTDESAILWGNFAVILSTPPQRITHFGVVRIEMDASGSIIDAGIFKQVEES